MLAHAGVKSDGTDFHAAFSLTAKKLSLFHTQNIIEVINLFSILFSILVSKHWWKKSFQKSWQDMKIAILQIAKTAQK